MPIADIADRCTILLLKVLRARDAEAAQLIRPYFDMALNDVSLDLFAKLFDVNSRIWDLEAEVRDLKRSKELSFEEIGRRAIAIRDWNAKRIAIKNAISQAANEPQHCEVKRDHASESADG